MPTSGSEATTRSSFAAHDLRPPGHEDSRMQDVALRWFILYFIGFIALGCNRQRMEAPKIPPPKVAVVTPVRRPVTTYHSFTGQTDAVESAEVRARVRGFLSKVAF